MTPEQIKDAMMILREEYRAWRTPAVTVVAGCGGNPYKVLVSCIISLRTRDEVTAAASARLFARAETPQEMSRIPEEDIARLIYPAGFYAVKAGQIREISRQLTEELGGIMPDSIEGLLMFKGVGRKTANLVLTLGFGTPGICVDTHVHRICNRWGYVATRTPDQTEAALRRILPSEHWIEINDLLVAFGQNHCHPVSPRCSTCRLSQLCGRIGVQRSR